MTMDNSHVSKVFEDIGKELAASPSQSGKERGCCIIRYGGASQPYDDVTETRCYEIAHKFPGARAEFRPGESCS